MDELKSLMIQTLNQNGVLGELRAKIRCAVFKCIDNQDEMTDAKGKSKSSFHWENQKARACLETQ